ncbi:MAG: acetate--CoA ligase family protein [Burkholderiales bacterium]|nr:acetate--CoA ligase family protein [Burkholderiales bacterium]
MAGDVSTVTAPAPVNAFERLLDPRGIAIVGASADPARPGAQTVRTLKELGYEGGVYPVNPRYTELDGYRCLPSLAAIEGACDVAVIALPAAQVPASIGHCAERGIRYAVVLGGGFRESGEAGAALEAAMLSTARARGVRIIGPNCLGFVNVGARAYAAWGSLTRPPRMQPGPVSAVLQSASFGMGIVIQCTAAGLGFRYVVTSGNEADITAPELIDAFAGDPGTRVILAYLEGVRDGRAFMAAARRALAAGKPVIVIKAGNTEQGRRAAESHTANLAGSYDAYRAAFRQCGVVEVDDVHEAADAALCFAGGRLPGGRRVAAIGGSGGAAASFSDNAERHELAMPPFSGETLEVLRATLPKLASLGNPVDYTAGYPRAGEGLDFRRAFAAVIGDPDIDQMAVMFAAAGPGQLVHGGEVLAEVARASPKPIVAYSSMNEALAPEGMARLRAAGIPVLASPRRVATAMARLADYAAARRRARVPERPAPGAGALLPPLPPGAATLNEHESKRLVAAAGIPVTRDRLLPLEPDARECAGLVFPLALKIVSPAIAHKSDIGCVRLNIADARELARAATEIVARARAAVPGARLDGLLASEMVCDAMEAIVGVVNDTAFGPVVALGLGGVFAETLRDVTFRVAPFGVDTAREMMGELRGRALLEAPRGRPALDAEALAEALARISALAWALCDRLAELDVNPLLVRPRGKGVVAADALAVLR